MKRYTLSDVAKLAGVDVSTVSRVLREDSTQRVRPEVRDNILQVARQLDYTPNLLARALRTSKTNSIGLVVPQIDNPVFSDAICGAEYSARMFGYSLIISYSSQEWTTPGTLRQLSQAHHVDGLLIASLDSNQAIVNELKNINVPYVMLNRFIEEVKYSVVLDTRSAARIAVQHLISLGHVDIAHLSGRPSGYNANERLKGYCEALEEADIKYDHRLVAAAGYTSNGGAEALQTIFKRASPSAIFCASIVSASGALHILHQMGKTIPKDISIIAIHDAPFAEILFPPLTTVATPTYDMGRIGVEILISLIQNKTPEMVRPLPPKGLVLRSSTAPYVRN